MRALVIAALLAVGCAPALDGVRQSLAASERLVVASADTFPAVDLAYQRSLEKRDDAVDAITRYRDNVRPKVLKAFADTEAALAAAETTVALVEQAKADKNDLGKVVAAVWAALQDLQTQLATIVIGGK